MNKKNTAIALLGTILAAPAAQGAVQLAGPALEAYGELELSVDFSDTDSPGDSRNTSLSSNATHLGFKGRHDIDPVTALIWQIEQEIRPDAADGRFATRNTYAGLTDNRLGTVLFGHHDTPYKTVGTRWGVLRDTVGERRAILGAGEDSGDVMNQRARNAILYQNTIEGIELQAMYATDAEDSNTNTVDDNDNDMISLGVWYTIGALELAAAYEDWSNLDTGGGPTPRESMDGLRLAANHKVGSAGRVGVIFESIDAGNTPDMDRTVFGVNGSYEMGTYTYEAQVLIAGDHDGGGSTGAMKIGAGVFNRLDDQTQVYAAFALTDNESNASFNAVDGEHGDEVDTTNGGTPNSLSAGLIFSF